MAYSNRFGMFIFFLAIILVFLWFAIMYFINHVIKKNKGKIEVEHDFEDKVADIEVEAFKKRKETELKRVRKKVLGK